MSTRIHNSIKGKDVTESDLQNVRNIIQHIFTEEVKVPTGSTTSIDGEKVDSMIDDLVSENVSMARICYPDSKPNERKKLQKVLDDITDSRIKVVATTRKKDLPYLGYLSSKEKKLNISWLNTYERLCDEMADFLGTETLEEVSKLKDYF